MRNKKEHQEGCHSEKTKCFLPWSLRIVDPHSPNQKVHVLKFHSLRVQMNDQDSKIPTIGQLAMQFVEECDTK